MKTWTTANSEGIKSTLPTPPVEPVTETTQTGGSPGAITSPPPRKIGLSPNHLPTTTENIVTVIHAPTGAGVGPEVDHPIVRTVTTATSTDDITAREAVAGTAIEPIANLAEEKRARCHQHQRRKICKLLQYQPKTQRSKT